ncbi:hypothetical protein LTR86_010822 [Recurvomyces mirabilis]|nr:hypothetical protein LTR86_010822 [Recurvomyces mirabilis]
MDAAFGAHTEWRNSETRMLAAIKTMLRDCPGQPKVCHTVEAVFAIPELFELILGSLDGYDILRAMRTNRAFRDTILGSTCLKRQIGLVSSTPPIPYAPLQNIPGATLLVAFRVPDRGNILTVTTHFDPARELPSLGTRTEAMLICQPPLYEMIIHRDCCVNKEDQKLFNTSGIRVGDIRDVTQVMRDEHKHCPWASSHVHRADGTVQVDVIFEGYMPCPREWRQVHDEAERERRAIMPYIRAKITGKLETMSLSRRANLFRSCPQQKASANARRIQVPTPPVHTILGQTVMFST